jgi:hypothetical protein
MEPDDALVSLIGLWPPFLADDVQQPVREVLGHSPPLGRDRDSLVRLAEQLRQLLPCLLVGACVCRLALQPSRGGQDKCLDLVAAVLAWREPVTRGHMETASFFHHVLCAKRVFGVLTVWLAPPSGGEA